MEKERKKDGAEFDDINDSSKSSARHGEKGGKSSSGEGKKDDSVLADLNDEEEA